MTNAEDRIHELVVARNAAALADHCEAKEQEYDLYVAIGRLASPLPVVATALLAAFIVQDDLSAARFLVKRTLPADRSPVFVGLATVAIQLWKRDYGGIHLALAEPALDAAVAGPAGAATTSAKIDGLLVQWVRDAVRQRALALIAKAYSSLPADRFAAMVGLAARSNGSSNGATGETVESIVAHLGWRFDTASSMIFPVAGSVAAVGGETQRGEAGMAGEAQEGMAVDMEPETGAAGGLVGHDPQRTRRGRPGLEQVGLLAEYAVRLEMK
ncbi:hypothetical protein BC831DRAFT_509371 [Entophlyctis helioformis]|nr:hypothetical protein BC831DRAFT_509371 [Entophlyctis helioformis]